MKLIDIVAPQLGEGLQEVRVVRLLKQVGESVARDEDLYEMETDKADVVVECAYAGTLHEWLVAEGDVLPIGAPLARIAVAGEVASAPQPSAPQPSAPQPAATPVGGPPERPGPARIPPRTRAHARRLGVPEEVLRTLPATSGKLMPADVDAYVESRGGVDRDEAPTPALFSDRPLAPAQRTLIQRLRHGQNVAVPATIKRPLATSSVARAVAGLAVHGASEPEVFALALARAAASHPRFRSVLLDDEILREADRFRLGVAVERPGDELVTAVVPDADALECEEFFATLRARLARALDGEDQAAARPHVILTHMGELGITDAVPVLVPPSAAVLFVGAAEGSGEAARVNLVLTFDHRLVNGAGAAYFLRALAEEVRGMGRRPLRTQELKGFSENPEAVSGSPRATGGARELAILLRETAGAVLGLEPQDLDPRQPLRTQGMSSSQAVELTGRLGAALDLQLPSSAVWNYPTLSALAEHLETLAGGSAGERPAGTSDDPGDPLDELSGEALEELLEKELEASLALGGGSR